MKNKHKLNILFFTLIAFLFSCTQSNESSKSEEIRNYRAIVTDSLTFDWLPEVKLLDYNDETGEFLLESQKDILVIDKEANVVSQFNPHVEGPNYVGDYDYGWIFYGENQLVAYGMNYFYLFDKNDGLIERYSYPVEVSSWWLLDGDPQMLFHYRKENNDKLLTFITAPNGPAYNSQAFQDSVKMVYLMDLENGESRPVMHKPETSIYRTIGRYIDRGFPYMPPCKAVRLLRLWLVIVYFISGMLNPISFLIRYPCLKSLSLILKPLLLERSLNPIGTELTDLSIVPER